jgi:hypothetical protein
VLCTREWIVQHSSALPLAANVLDLPPCIGGRREYS